MNKKLPARPNLDHLKGQAKSLLSYYQNQQPEAISAFQEFHASNAEPKLSDAQLVLARKLGYASWPKLVHYVETLRSLEGTWKFRSLVVGGNEMPEVAFRDSRLVMNGDRFNMLSPEGDYLGEFDIDVEAKPNTIDIEFVEGPEAGNSCYGIFELTGNDLVICLGLVGASRPTEFVAPAGTQHALEKLVRVTSNAPVTEGKPQPKKQEKAGPMVADPADFQVVTPEVEAIQGEWLPLEVINNGVPLPANFLAYGLRVCEGTHVTVTFGGQKMVDVFARVLGDGSIDYMVASGGGWRANGMHGRLRFGSSVGVYV